MLSQQRDVLHALGQWGQAQADHVQAVEQVIPKEPLGHARLQVLMRGRNHPHAALHRLVAPHAVEVAFGQHPQQPRLHLGRHVADLIQKESPPFGLLETATPQGLRAREGAPFVPEQFRFHQVTRDGRHVDRHERPFSPHAVLMQCPRHPFLARAGLTRQQHGGIGSGQTADGTVHRLHGRCLAQQAGIRHAGSGLGGRSRLSLRPPFRIRGGTGPRAPTR